MPLSPTMTAAHHVNPPVLSPTFTSNELAPLNSQQHEHFAKAIRPGINADQLVLPSMGSEQGQQVTTPHLHVTSNPAQIQYGHTNLPPLTTSHPPTQLHVPHHVEGTPFVPAVNTPAVASHYTNPQAVTSPTPSSSSRVAMLQHLPHLEPQHAPQQVHQQTGLHASPFAPTTPAVHTQGRPKSPSGNSQNEQEMHHGFPRTPSIMPDHCAFSPQLPPMTPMRQFPPVSQHPERDSPAAQDLLHAFATKFDNRMHSVDVYRHSQSPHLYHLPHLEATEIVAWKEHALVDVNKHCLLPRHLSELESKLAKSRRLQ